MTFLDIFKKKTITTDLDLGICGVVKLHYTKGNTCPYQIEDPNNEIYVNPQETKDLAISAYMYNYLIRFKDYLGNYKPAYMNVTTYTRKAYIASSFSQIPTYEKLREYLNREGISLSYDWVKETEGRKRKRIDKQEQVMFFNKEKTGIFHADMMFLIMPCGNDSLVEFGMALSKNIPIVIVYPNTLFPKPDEEFPTSLFNSENVQLGIFDPNTLTLTIPTT